MTVTAAVSSSLKASVDETRNRHIAAVNAGDAGAATSLFAPEGILLPPDQPALEGTTAIGAWFAQLFGNVRVQGFSLQPAAVEEHGDIAIEHGSWKATFAPKDGSAVVPAGGTYLTIYARLADGNVKMIRDTFNGLPGGR